MRSERLELPFARAGVDTLSALFDEPSGEPRASAVLLAHGAGSALDSPALARLAEGLCQRGFPVLRFNYPYRERALRAGKRMARMDPRAELERAHEVALAACARLAPGKRLILAGRSLGGRIGTHLAAKGAPCAAVVAFGYPLSPRASRGGRSSGRRPEESRSAHFPAVAVPALFVQGTRDELCELPLLERALATLGGPWRLVVIEGADHSFRLPRASGRSPADVDLELVDALDRWEREGFPG